MILSRSFLLREVTGRKFQVEDKWIREVGGGRSIVTARKSKEFKSVKIHEAERCFNDHFETSLRPPFPLPKKKKNKILSGFPLETLIIEKKKKIIFRTIHFLKTIFQISKFFNFFKLLFQVLKRKKKKNFLLHAHIFSITKHLRLNVRSSPLPSSKIKIYI